MNSGTEGVGIDGVGVGVWANAGLAIIRLDTAKRTMRSNEKLLLTLLIFYAPTFEMVCLLELTGFRLLIRIIMVANKNTITTRTIMIINKSDELEALLTDVKVGVGVSVELGIGDSVEVGIGDSVGFGEVVEAVEFEL